jgi:hypothetical protein
MPSSFQSDWNHFWRLKARSMEVWFNPRIFHREDNVNLSAFIASHNGRIYFTMFRALGRCYQYSAHWARSATGIVVFWPVTSGNNRSPTAQHKYTFSTRSTYHVCIRESGRYGSGLSPPNTVKLGNMTNSASATLTQDVATLFER